MSSYEIPPGVDYVHFQDRFSIQDARNYRIDRKIYNDTTLHLLGEMAHLYPNQSSMFQIINNELDGRLPIVPRNQKDLSREYDYDFISPNGWSFKSLFQIIGSFPPTVEQYRVLRHFLFQPDLDVRNNTAQVIDMRLRRYGAAIGEEFENIIHNDPDYTGRLHLWINHSRKFALERRTDRWYETLYNIPIKPAAIRKDIPDQQLQIYFGIGKGNFFEPQAASERAFQESEIKNIKSMLDIISQIKTLDRQGELTDQKKEEINERLNKLDDQFNEAIATPALPYVGTMLGQLWRLSQRDIIQAISSVINNPEKFDTSIFSGMHNDQIVALGILVSTFIKDQEAQKVFINQAIQTLKWQENIKVVTALARASYTLKVEDIIENILPLTRKLTKNDPFNMMAKRAASSLSYAIARDVGHEKVPQPKPQELPYFGFP